MNWSLQLLISVLTIIGSVLASLGAVYLARRRLFEVEQHKNKIEFSRKIAPPLWRIAGWLSFASVKERLYEEVKTDLSMFFDCYGEATLLLSPTTLEVYRNAFLILVSCHFIPPILPDPDFQRKDEIRVALYSLIAALRVEIGVDPLDKSLYSTIGIQPNKVQIGNP